VGEGGDVVRRTGDRGLPHRAVEPRRGSKRRSTPSWRAEATRRWPKPVAVYMFTPCADLLTSGYAEAL